MAQIKFAASQKRQEVTKIDEKEGDEPLKIRLGLRQLQNCRCTA